MIGYVYLLSNRKIISVVENVESYTNDSITGKGGGVRGIDLTKAGYTIAEESRFGLGDNLPIDIVDRRDLVVDQNLDRDIQLQIALAELAEAQEADKTETQLALAELAEILSGGA